ncbi:MAG: serine hydrolase domain-containing protein [Pseudomonadota bacterium]|nr:serine hydrolase domain-containing protein [Pseudomonadota bacterium]
MHITPLQSIASMRRMQTARLLAALIFSALLFGCGGDDNPPPATLEDEIRLALDALDSDRDFTLVLEANNGHRFIHSTGASTEYTDYESASTSKWVSATVILDLVAQGVMTLEDHPQDHIDFWPETGRLGEIRLRHLLSFSSGLSNEPLCINARRFDFSECVTRILEQNSDIPPPGAEFNYNSAHLQVAGLMAMRALDPSGGTAWSDVFARFQARTGLFPAAAFDLPSLENPRLAGGMHWRAIEYTDFLAALYRYRVLTPELIQAMSTDQIANATIVKTPAGEDRGLDWHYGFGNWIECETVPFTCAEPSRFSSPGAYGAYPFMDREHGYFGILARQGLLGSQAEGFRIVTEVEPLLQQWAALHQ